MGAYGRRSRIAAFLRPSVRRRAVRAALAQRGWQYLEVLRVALVAPAPYRQTKTCGRVGGPGQSSKEHTFSARAPVNTFANCIHSVESRSDGGRYARRSALPSETDPIREAVRIPPPGWHWVIGGQVGPPPVAPGLWPGGRLVDPQATPLFDELGNVFAHPQPAEAEELLSIELETPALPGLQRFGPRAVPLDLGFDQMLLQRDGKVLARAGNPPMSHGLIDGTQAT